MPASAAPSTLAPAVLPLASTTTPMKPAVMPMARRVWIFSPKSSSASSGAKMAVVALLIAATPAGARPVAQANSRKGIAELIEPMATTRHTHRRWKLRAVAPQEGQQRQCAQCQPQFHQRNGAELGRGHALEHEGSAPDRAEQGEFEGVSQACVARLRGFAVDMCALCDDPRRCFIPILAAPA